MAAHGLSRFPKTRPNFQGSEGDGTRNRRADRRHVVFYLRDLDGEQDLLAARGTLCDKVVASDRLPATSAGDN
jgi:hypothetical protein